MARSFAIRSFVLATAAACRLASATPGQVFADASSNVPDTGSYSENVDFADVDQDGDWDAMLADGGDLGNDQNRLYVNQGGFQGGSIGTFLDGTAAHLPLISDSSRDVEFVDFDGDGDVDSYTANHSQISIQGDRWWTNQGGKQGGTAGFFVDETAFRWLGLGLPGSSLAPGFVLNEGFLDWVPDGEFGDFDDDGDIDLLHASYGNNYGGGTPTRIFLNNGQGRFSEFNPSGYQLLTDLILNGNPAIWAEGLQQGSTFDTLGNFADVATAAVDVDIGDIDGDFDLDIFQGERYGQPRMFKNRLAETGGLAFRDVTGAPGLGTFPAGYVSGPDNFEQEFGDMDRDGDLDIYGLNYPGLADAVFNNTGPGVYDGMQILPSSTNDDEEGDFLDFDGDGDLDLYIAAFANTNRLYRNEYAGGGPGTFSYTFVSAAASGIAGSQRSRDADVADVDADGDYDVMTAEDGNQNELLYENVTQVADAFAPYVPNVEQMPSVSAAPGLVSLRAQVYDNAPYYVVWYATVRLEVTVGGFRLPDRPMRSSQGQIFRGLVPANLVGAVDYAIRATDEHGNTGASATLSYAASGGPVGTVYGSSSPGSLGAPTAQVLSVPYAGSELVLAGGNAPAGVFSFLGVSLLKLTPALDLGGGLIANLGAPLAALHAQPTDAAGHHVAVYSLPPGTAGIPLNVQFVTLDGTGGNLFAASQGVEFTIL